VLVATIAPEHV